MKPRLHFLGVCADFRFPLLAQLARPLGGTLPEPWVDHSRDCPC